MSLQTRYYSALSAMHALDMRRSYIYILNTCIKATASIHVHVLVYRSPRQKHILEANPKKNKAIVRIVNE